ncbi:multidrug transporter [Candidatus Nomurabacteria bacterium RIFCSPHIGHO2_02_FULL_37_45]|uniref:Multidrug transporter n=2 Tax=Candidatus Nomuraibacteriota TaxID=1752729 RepID=A0A1F6Y658_9BACT|nr:MAG: multidrug transporter [Candidatus Nomurabacteria bacterium RIFCSPHIGHO2_01_FULL_37_110]OGI71154.1 MAG: multidrug transporter [Candidatus Nomurabacteria bacterium RIFCSPHIGHO2_02_FULL_37_45]OGI78811.1 MAG: multidrug transporter [Candidatus Nomurabacteria bacterium RIFCSPHIGHO2_12_FULL_37_29]OGI85494.1 MAG: multidrug transporter [Candidatus Nomurabacteria bacterium RIFCSPLOWO2_01_FULL_37_49]OGJ01805.1 MAG: multidrug transporter [Candidatus Nomurabacteria bacterium RIFCSPLOWO2_12_FULL_37_8
MEILLQLWGGLFYLFAKIFLARAEGEENSKWRTWGWITYLLGVPPWVIILALNQNWIAMALEAGGIPAIILGIIISVKQLEQAPRVIDKGTKIFTWILIIIGTMYSVYDFGGVTAFSQILELGVTVGFLLGTYLLAKKDGKGWLCFILMNVSMGTLMLIQEKWIFAILQAISICFVIYGFIKSKKIRAIINNT